MTKDVTAEDISTHNRTDVDLSPDDIIVHNMKINYGSKVQAGLLRMLSHTLLRCIPLRALVDLPLREPRAAKGVVVSDVMSPVVCARL